MIHRDIVYFEKAGSQNTEDTVRLALARAKELAIGHVVVASSSGATGLLAAKAFQGTGIKVIVVGHHVGFSGPGQQDLEEQYSRQLKAMGVTVLQASHALSGVERSITRRLGGASRVEAIAEALRTVISVGTKVAVEISVMAADAGLVPVDGRTEIIAIGGTWSGADTACVIRPAHANNFFDLHVMEIVCMPREKSRE
ncbi:MAG: Pyruvate kinase, alpha/beta domain [Methanocella sp. PtaU1.Bin125]|nr:MAG: Pyruvate kinase, alpha/beta domain [Methanocella sp. PtaU1.Bin125]